MTQGCSGKNISGFFSQKFITVLVIVFVLVMGMLGTNTVKAASVTQSATNSEYGHTVSMNATVQNVDLKIYSKYKNSILKGDNETDIGKAVPGTTIVVTATPRPTSNQEVSSSSVRFQPLRIEKDFPMIKGANRHFDKEKSAVTASYTVPNGVEMIRVYADVGYGPFHDKDGGSQWVYAGRTYFIFTSDEAFKKAYKIATGKSLTGNISTPTNNDKGTDKNGDADDDDGGITIYHIGGGLFLVVVGGGAAFFFIGGGGGGGAPTGNPADVPPPDEPETVVYTDPATGAQSIYEKDPDTGQWVNPYTGGVLDPDDLNRFNNQRISDRRWMDDEVKNLEDRNTAFDNDLKNDWQDMLDNEAEIDRQGRKDQMAINTGTYGMTDDQRKAYLTNRQNGYETDMKNAHRTANNWDTVVQTAEVVQTAADIGVDTLAVVTAPVGGGLVADGYAVLKNIGGSAADAAASGRSIVGGIAQGITNAAVDVAQNHAGTKWQKLGSYVGGEGLKGGIEAGINGESVVKGVFKGAGKGITKIGVEKVANGISDAASKTNFNNFKNHYNKINNVYSKGISQKSTNALRQMNYQKFASKETGNLWKNGISQGVGKNLGTKVFD